MDDGLKITKHVHGPIFDGRADRALEDFRREIEKVVAHQAFAEVHHVTERSFKTRTPYYETQIAVREHPNRHVVTDRGVIYGAWLEGVGSRNKTTSFKGYHMFRIATGVTGAKVQGLGEFVLRRYLPRMR